MTELDPEGIESRALLQAVDFTSARVLEIGTGDGRLAYRYAERPSSVVAVELERESLAVARKACPPRLQSHVRFVQGDAATLPFHRDSFDIAVLAWSL